MKERRKLKVIKHDFYEYTLYSDMIGEYTFWKEDTSTEIFKKADYDWYIDVAVEKANKVPKDSWHLITYELLISYRNAIREGYQRGFDQNLQNRYDHPRNRNTIKGIKGYIKKIHLLIEKEIDELDKMNIEEEIAKLEKEYEQLNLNIAGHFQNNNELTNRKEAIRDRLKQLKG